MLRDPSLIPLSHQHQHALALCVRIDRALAAAPEITEFPAQRQNILEDFDAEISGHFYAEESILFPALHGFPDLTALVDELIAEHRSMEALVERLRSASDRGLITEFTAVLRPHVRKEEGILFETAQKLLSREELDRLGEALKAAL